MAGRWCRLKQNEHGKIIAAAAKKHLVPIGAQRKGQSRTWFCDQKYWLILIEFQPSGWSKGSYLNVGAHWLWHLRDLSFDYGRIRIANFVPFETAEQFQPEAERLATEAAAEVGQLRDVFASLEDTARRLMLAVINGGTHWSVYHAAVAAGLVGDVVGSRQLFERVRIDFAGDQTWRQEIRSIAVQLAEALSSRRAYREAVQELIQRNRTLNKLPSCLDPLPSEA